MPGARDMHRRNLSRRCGAAEAILAALALSSCVSSGVGDRRSRATSDAGQRDGYLSEKFPLTNHEAAATGGHPNRALDSSTFGKPGLEFGKRAEAGAAAADAGLPLSWRETNAAGVGVEVGADDSPSPLTFTSKNSYPPITWSPWTHLAEPFRQAVLTAQSTVGDPDGGDVFIWTLPEENGAMYEGREIKHTFKTVGRKSVTLTQTVVSTGVNYTWKGYIMVKYVRREIRKLHESDREALFQAMETLYRLPTAEGFERYGAEYKGIDYFVQMHLDGAGVKDCDHWHDDAGIMTHHVGYTLQFEQMLQLVNPSVTIPYWEYTREAAEGMSSYGESIVFDDNWFGSFSPDNSLHTVTKGRWAFLKVMDNAWEFVHNPYGLLSAPWNVDANPFVTRHNKTNNEVATDMVSCSMYADCFSSTTLGSISSCLNGETHGPVHILTGGQWENPREDFIRKVGYYEMVPLVSKFLWRKGYLRLPDSCTPGAGECKASCPSELYESRGMTPYDVLMDVHALAWAAHTSGGTLHYDNISDKWEIMGHQDDLVFQSEFWLQMLESFCDPGKVGTMYTSAAPYDPLFWVVHPTSDRFLAWRRILGREGASGWDFDETWSYKHAMVVGETGYVCDWTGISDDPTAMPSCVKGVCGGHNADDLLPFNVQVNGKTVKLTNSEWMDLIYPTNENLPYMYDNFRWDHCTVEGYDFGTS